jgi:hypothetical protein
LGAADTRGSFSYLQVDAKNVHLLCLKCAASQEGRLFLRLCEMEGKDAKVKIAFSFDISEACFATSSVVSMGRSMRVHAN